MRNHFNIRVFSYEVDDHLQDSSVSVCYGFASSFYDQIETIKKDLSPYEMEQANRFMSKSDSENYIVAHYFLRKSLSDCLKKPPGSLDIKFAYMKKPFLCDFSIDFNLSHSKDIFAVVIANKPDVQVGVDIEKNVFLKDYNSITRNYMHSDEKSYISNNSLTAEEQLTRFYEIWTRKEAFLKMLGLGITTQLGDVNMVSGGRTIDIDIPDDLQVHGNDAYIYTIKQNEFILSVVVQT